MHENQVTLTLSWPLMLSWIMHRGWATRRQHTLPYRGNQNGLSSGRTKRLGISRGRGEDKKRRGFVTHLLLLVTNHVSWNHPGRVRFSVLCEPAGYTLAPFRQNTLGKKSRWHSVMKYYPSVCVSGRIVILTVQTGQGIKAEAHFQVLHFHHWIHKQLQTQTQHGSFSQRSIPLCPPVGSLSWVLEHPGRSPRPHNCCTARHEAGTLDPPRCCLYTFI